MREISGCKNNKKLENAIAAHINSGVIINKLREINRPQDIRKCMPKEYTSSNFDSYQNHPLMVILPHVFKDKSQKFKDDALICVLGNIEYDSRWRDEPDVRALMLALVESGANAHIVTENNVGVLHYVHYDIDYVKRIIPKIKDPNGYTDDYGYTPLFDATTVEVAKILLAHGVSPHRESTSVFKRTPLHVAVDERYEPGLLELYLGKYNLDIEALSRRRTALDELAHNACRYHQTVFYKDGDEVKALKTKTQILLKYGAYEHTALSILKKKIDANPKFKNPAACFMYGLLTRHAYEKEAARLRNIEIN
jgi:hypothetical protein